MARHYHFTLADYDRMTVDEILRFFELLKEQKDLEAEEVQRGAQAGGRQAIM